MDEIRLGIVGYGGMGGAHGAYLRKDPVPGGRVAAVCDIRPERLVAAKKDFGDDMPTYASIDELIAAKVVDAVFIATPHYAHPPLAVQAFQAGLHVLTEKPAGVYARQVREMNEAAARSGKVFGIMYNQRTLPAHRKIKDLIDSGELGEIHRNLYVVTDWYRTQCYYDGGDWRATWEGEGGGVLINQCPHNLDIWQHVCGMPSSVTTQMGFGKYHDIEVEDDVTTMVKYPNGAIGVFITTTGEGAGSERWEIVGDRGTLLYENGKLVLRKTRQSVREHLATCPQGMQPPETWRCEIPFGRGGGHRDIMANFVAAIREGKPLIAPGEEGIRGLQISNAMHLSAWLGQSVDVPVDEDLYWKKLQEKIASSTKRKKAKGADKAMDFAGTF
jgi:predicted dehydrogenase